MFVGSTGPKETVGRGGKRCAVVVFRDECTRYMRVETACDGRMDDGGDNVERDLEDGTRAFHALLAGDQSNFQPGGPIEKHRALVKEPQSYSAACDSVNRGILLGKMRPEFQGLIDNKTFDLAELPAGRRPISAKWVFVWKQNQEGEVVRAKARLVAKGFLQAEGTDFLETFSPAPVPSSTRMIAITAL